MSRSKLGDGRFQQHETLMSDGASCAAIRTPLARGIKVACAKYAVLEAEKGKLFLFGQC